MNLNIFSPQEYGGENIFKYIFSPKNTVVKIYLDIFLPPPKKITVVKIYFNIFSPPKYGSENIFKYIFSPKIWW